MLKIIEAIACSDASAIRGWLTIFLGVAALALTYRGLNTWREQLHGRKQWETASSLMRVAYKLNNVAKISYRSIKNRNSVTDADNNSNIWQFMLKTEINIYKEELSECTNELYNVKADVAVHLSPFLGEHTNALMRLANAMATQLNYLSTGLNFSVDNPDNVLHFTMTSDALTVADNVDYARDFSRVISALEHDLDPYLPKSRRFASLKPIEKWAEFESENASRYFSNYV